MVKLAMKNCVTSIEDCVLTKKELELIFHQNKFIVFEKVQLKKNYSAIVPHFFHRYIMHGKFW